MKKLSDPEKTLYLIDGTGFSYRAFFAIRNLQNSRGLPTGAIFGFVNAFKKIINEFHPLYLGVCFDVSRKTFRQKKFKDYKITRPAMPDDFKIQISWIKNIIKSYSTQLVELEGYEADDVIATLATQAERKGFKCIVFSSDKDILQIVEDRNVMVYHPSKDILFDEAKVIKEMGIKPKNITDFIGLSGDSVDNIPGARGIGPKTAVSLINDFGPVDKILENIPKIPRDSLKKLISSSRDSILLSKELAILDREVPLDLDIECLKVGKPDYAGLNKIFRELNFKSLIEKVDKDETSVNLSSTDYKQELASKIKKDKKIIFYLSPDTMHVLHAKKVYKVSTIAQIQDLLEDSSILKVSFDVKQAILQLSKKKLTLRGPYFDVMVAAYLAKSYLQDMSLENIVWEYLSQAKIDVEESRKVYYIGQLYDVLARKLKAQNLEKVFVEIEIPLIEVLVWMEQSPITIDVGFLKKTFFSLKKKQSWLEQDIFGLAQTQFNLNSPKQLSDILFNRLGLSPVKRTRTGFSTNEEALNKLKKAHPIIEKILEYRKLSKLLSTYIEPFIHQAEEHKGKIFPQFSQVQSATGRLVSFSPNLQNIPIRQAQARSIRGAFISSFKEGLILSADYSQIELRVLAHICDDANLIQAFLNHKDIHRTTASLLFGKKDQEVSGQEREFAKRINFGIVYGMSSYGLSKELAITIEEAESFIAEYFARYPKVEKFVSQTMKKAEERGYVETLFGRRRYLENINNSNRILREYALRQAINAPIQGSAADIIKLAMIKLFKEFRNNNLKSKLLIQIHDELVFDVDHSEIKKVSFLVKDIMEHIVTLKVPIEVNICWGRTWLEATK